MSHPAVNGSPVKVGERVRITNLASFWFGRVVVVMELGKAGGIYYQVPGTQERAYLPFGWSKRYQDAD